MHKSCWSPGRPAVLSGLRLPVSNQKQLWVCLCVGVCDMQLVHSLRNCKQTVIIGYLCCQVPSSLAMRRYNFTLGTTACQFCRQGGVWTSTISSTWILLSVATCHLSHLKLKSPWSPSRRPISTILLVTMATQDSRYEVSAPGHLTLSFIPQLWLQPLPEKLRWFQRVAGQSPTP